MEKSSDTTRMANDGKKPTSMPPKPDPSEDKRVKALMRDSFVLVYDFFDFYGAGLSAELGSRASSI